MIYCISHHSPTRIPRPNQGKPPLRFTVYPSINLSRIPRPTKAHNPWVYHNPQCGSGITRPCVHSFRDPPHSSSNPSDNPSQPKHENPITSWLFGNCKTRLKTLSHLENSSFLFSSFIPSYFLPHSFLFSSFPFLIQCQSAPRKL